MKSFTGRFMSMRFERAMPGVLVAIAVMEAAAADRPVFKHPLDGRPIDVTPKAGEVETAAVRRFKQTGANLYRNDASAIQAGKTLYDQWCQICHNSDATGKLAPPLIGTRYIYPQTATDVGMFAIIYGGASGAMQPFSLRDLTQDDMLKIIAYIRTLEQKRGP